MPDIKVIEKKNIWFIDVAIPGEARIEEKQLEKIMKHKDLQIKVESLWKKKSIAIPIMTGVLGLIPKELPE